MPTGELSAQIAEGENMLRARGLLLGTCGLLSGVDRARAIVIGTPEASLVEIPLDSEVRGDNPMTDLATHLVLYKVFPEIGAVVQPHAHFAMCWAQARKSIPCLGALHASTFQGEIPLTVSLTEVEVVGDWEYHTGKAIARCFRDRDPLACPAALVPGVGPFVWGRTVDDALQHAILLEEVARLAWHTLALDPFAQPLERYAQAKHFHTSHAAGALQGP